MSFFELIIVFEVFEQCKSTPFYESKQENHYTILHFYYFYVTLQANSKHSTIMAYSRLTAAEAAALIKNGDHIAMSGFTPAGVAKATTKELAKIALAEHEAGREFKVAIFTGASTGQSTDGDLANAQAILYRAPYTTNPDFRKHVNMGEIPYND